MARKKKKPTPEQVLAETVVSPSDGVVGDGDLLPRQERDPGNTHDEPTELAPPEREPPKVVANAPEIAATPSTEAPKPKLHGMCRCDKADCPNCNYIKAKLAATIERARAAGTLPPPAGPKEPCEKRGERVRVAGSSKLWVKCLDVALPNKGKAVVCECEGCNNTCPGYVKGEPE